MSNLVDLPKEDNPLPVQRKDISIININTLIVELAMKPWNVAQFEEYRSSTTDFVRDQLVRLINDPRCKTIVVIAPVKCGKREIVEYTAMRDKCENSPRHHIFISAWHRTADETQREELRHHNMTVHSIVTPKAVELCIYNKINHL